MTNLERVRKELSPARRKKVQVRSAQLIAEEMTLQELRRARKLTQVRMAQQLGIGQDGVSKLEKRADLMISTLRKTVEAMGGRLSLVAEFPDGNPVVLSGISEDGPNLKPTGKHKLTICTCLPCGLQGSLDAADHIKAKLGIDFGETTGDGRFTLKEGECMGACADAPVMIVNNKRMCSFMSNDKIDQLVEELK